MGFRTSGLAVVLIAILHGFSHLSDALFNE